MSLQLLKRASAPDQPGQTMIDAGDQAHKDPFEGIRCPLCDWRPSASSRWTCICEGTPEPFFEGCGTVWNTFSTRGRCPGCSHQWQWTTCLRCQQASLHVDWYDAANH